MYSPSYVLSLFLAVLCIGLAAQPAEAQLAPVSPTGFTTERTPTFEWTAGRSYRELRVLVCSSAPCTENAEADIAHIAPPASATSIVLPVGQTNPITGQPVQTLGLGAVYWRIVGNKAASGDDWENSPLGTFTVVSTTPSLLARLDVDGQAVSHGQTIDVDPGTVSLDASRSIGAGFYRFQANGQTVQLGYDADVDLHIEEDETKTIRLTVSADDLESPVHSLTVTVKGRASAGGAPGITLVRPLSTAGPEPAFEWALSRTYRELRLSVCSQAPCEALADADLAFAAPSSGATSLVYPTGQTNPVTGNPTPALTPGQTVYWRVRGNKATVGDDWEDSALGSFTVQQSVSLAAVLAVDGVQVSDGQQVDVDAGSVTLDASASPGAGFYRFLADGQTLQVGYDADVDVQIEENETKVIRLTVAADDLESPVRSLTVTLTGRPPAGGSTGITLVRPLSTAGTQPTFEWLLGRSYRELRLAVCSEAPCEAVSDADLAFAAPSAGTTSLAYPAGETNPVTGNPTPALTPGQTVYWRVRGNKATVGDDWEASALGSFTVDSPALLTAILRVDGVRVTDGERLDVFAGSIALDASESLGAGFYRFMVDGQTRRLGFEPEHTLTLQAGDTKTITLRVSADDLESPIDELSVTLSAQPFPEHAITLATPAGSVPITTPTFAWQGVGTFHEYRLWVCPTDQCNTDADATIVHAAPAPGHSTLAYPTGQTNPVTGNAIQPLEPGRTYRWRVKGNRSATGDDWLLSAPRTFTVDAEAGSGTQLANLQPAGVTVDPAGIELTWACTHDGVPCEDAVIDPQEEPVRRIILSDDSFDDFDGTLGYMAALAAHGRLLPGTNERVQVELWLAEASAPNYRCPRPDGYGVGQTLVCTGNNGEYITSADRPVEASYRWINRVISEAGLTGEVEVARGVDDYLTSPTGFRPLTGGVRALYDVLTEPDVCTRDNPCYIVAGGPLSTVVSALHHAKQAVPDIARRVVVSLISTGIESSGGQVTKFIAHGKNMVDDPFGWKALFESFPGITVYHFPTLNNNQSFIYGTVLPVADMRWPSWSAPDNAHPANRIYRMIRGFESDRAMCGNQSCKNDRRDIQTPNSGTARWDFNRWYWWQDEASWRSRWWMGDLYTLVPALIEPASGQFDLVEAPRIEEGGSCSSSATCHCQSFSSRPSVCLYTEPGAGRAMLRTYVGSVDTRLMPAHKSWINRWATPPAPPPDGGSSVPITYDLVLSAGAGDLLSVTGLSEPRYAITSPLPPGGSFTWTVKARRDGETLDEASATFSTVSETVYAARITHAGRLVGAGETVYVEAGRPQVFSGILSSGQPVRFAWSESGTTLGVAPDLDRTWVEAGTHTLRLQIGDQSQWRHETEITVEVIEPTLQVTNLLPNEVFDEPTAGTTLSWKVFANSGGGGTCQADVAVTDPQPIDASHEAANTLTASFTVAGSARLTAGTSVRLVPGMRVPAGTRLDAWIEGCTEGPNLSVAGVEQTANYAYDVMVWSEDGVTLHDTQGSTASPNLPDFPTDVLDGSTRYHWQIRVLDPNAGFTVVALSEVATFGTAGSGPGVPQPFAPANGEQGVALDVDLEWNPPAGGAGPYWVQVASSMAHFGAPAELLVNVSGVAGLSHPLHNLGQGSVVFWRVKACQDTTCAGPWSAISSFTTRTDLDAPFVLGLRPDGAGVATTWSGQAPTDERIPVLAWRALPEAEAYRIQVVADGQSVPVFDTRYPVNQLLARATLDGYLANDDLFDPARLSGTQEPAGVLIPPGTLAQSARYTWRVRAEAGSEIGAWSEAWTFETVSPRVARYYYLRDHIGSIRVTFDDEGDVVHAQDYYPFGETMPGRRLDRSGKAPTEGFTGHERDDETGLYYGLARYYDAVAGRWTTPDPNADTYAAWSPYHYAAQRPINITDPDGKDWYRNDRTGEVNWHDSSDGMLTIDGVRHTNVGTTHEEEVEGGRVLYGNSPDHSLFVPDGMHVIRVVRDTETDASTTSTFTITGTHFSGYILEPAGPSSTVSMSDRRIMPGPYRLSPHHGRRHRDTHVLRDVPGRSAILFHSGSEPDHTLGCLMPGSSRSVDRVAGSRVLFGQVRDFIKDAGSDNVVVFISEAL